MATRNDTVEGERDVDVTESLPHSKRRRFLLHCGHCDRSLPKSTYYRHREAFFNPVSGHWEKDDLQSLGSSSDNSTPHSEAGTQKYDILQCR